MNDKIEDTVEDRLRFLISAYRRNAKDYGLQNGAKEVLRQLESILFRNNYIWDDIVNSEMWINRETVLVPSDPKIMTPS